jgi:glycosyltransferase involved in cell wall biosynthesis
MQHGTPSLISKQSGVAEVMTHVLKVDFWDVDEMANKILATLRYGVMQKQLIAQGREELPRFSWKHAAEKVSQLYQSLRNLITS